MAGKPATSSVAFELAMRLVRSTSGNFATLTALTAPVALILAAFAIDEGALFIEKRDLQSLADLAAIVAAADIDHAETAAALVLRDNGFAGGSEVPDEDQLLPSDGNGCGIAVTRGRYTADPSIAPSERFVVDEKSPNAVRVSICRSGVRYFSAAFFDAPRVGARAVAATRDEATFSVGSRLARLDGGIANKVLGGLTGSSVSLTVMDYEALLSADVGLLSFLDALNGNLALEALDYNDVLLADATLSQIASALARTEGIDGAARIAAGRLAAQLKGAGSKVALSKLLELGSLGVLPVGFAATAKNEPLLGAMELFSAAAALSAANGDRQVDIDLAASVSGLADVKLALAIGEPPQFASWFRTGGEGTIARTAQTRLFLDIAIGGSGALAASRVRLPLYAELAHASARLARLSCPDTPGATPGVVIATRSGVARLRIADVDKATLARFGQSPALARAALLATPAASVTGWAEINTADDDATRLRFTSGDIDKRRVKTASTTQVTGSLTQALLERLDLEVRVAGVTLGTSQVLNRVVADTLDMATPTVDRLLASVTATLGLSLGEADVRVHAARCGSAVLVQ